MSKKKARSHTKPGEIPQILHFKPRNLAYILLPGKVKKYLGRYDGGIVTPELEAERLRIWSEYLANQKLDPDAKKEEQVTVAVLADRYIEYAKTHFVKNGRPTGMTDLLVYTVRPLLQLYAALPVAKFTTVELKAVRELMIASKTKDGKTRLCLNTINQRITYIRMMFRWGVENRLVENSVYSELLTVSGLDPERPGSVRTTKKVRFVSDKVSEAVLKFVPPAIGDMVRVHRLTGMRPGEITSLRPCDIYREGDVFPEDYEFIVAGIDGRATVLDGCWVYIPEEHKTEHKGKLRFGRLKQGVNHRLGGLLDELVEVLTTGENFQTG